MNEQDKEYLEKLYAGLAMVGLLMNGDYTIFEIPKLSKTLAAEMMKEDSEDGIVSIVKRKRSVK